MKDNEAYPMDEQCTMCTEQDYNFLHRFLDATKANLFFAKGLILVEGDAENLIVPEIAKIIGRDLHHYGISIVNVGSTAYKRYVKIFQRKDGRKFNMPISIISDLDIRSIEYYDDNNRPQVYRITEEVKQYLSEHHGNDVNWNNLPIILNPSELDKFLDTNKKGRFKSGHKDTIKSYFKSITSDITSDDIELLRDVKRKSSDAQYHDDIRIYLPKCWTLEYDIARSALFKKLAYATNLAKAERDDCDMTVELKSKIKSEVESKYGDITNESTAYQIFKPLNDGSVSKAITAQYFAEALSDTDKDTLESDEYLKYIVDAINHVTCDAYGLC
jgi:putative ATP-dependent endonuclease of OLD family